MPLRRRLDLRDPAVTEPDPPIQDGAGEDLQRFVIRSREDVLRILRALRDTSEPVSAHFDHGRGVLITTIESLDPATGRLILGLGPDPALSARLLGSGRIVFRSRHGRVPVQFRASGARALQHDGHAAFAIELPPDLLYLQRRELLRVTTSLRDPVQVRLECGAGEALAFQAQDIGGGGFSGIAAMPAGQDVPGTRFPSCTLTFSDDRSFTCEVELRAVVPHRQRSGTDTTLLRFRFVGLPGPAERTVQHYVLRRQREQRRIGK
jgi:c-di-GMP-binding flagellar brake protein YcgR